jgi:hypothetical protein
VPEQYRQFDLEDKVAITGVTTTLIYMYVVPAKAEGTWNAKLPAGLAREPVRISLKQQITRITGSARVDGKDVPLEEAKLKGEQLTFKLALGGKSYDFSGTVKGPSMEGSVDGGGTKGAWSAVQGK